MKMQDIQAGERVFLALAPSPEAEITLADYRLATVIGVWSLGDLGWGVGTDADNPAVRIQFTGSMREELVSTSDLHPFSHDTMRQVVEARLAAINRSIRTNEQAEQAHHQLRSETTGLLAHAAQYSFASDRLVGWTDNELTALREAAQLAVRQRAADYQEQLAAEREAAKRAPLPGQMAIEVDTQ